MVDLYLNTRFFGYKDSYTNYDFDVNKMLLFKKSNNKYIIRYYDVNKMTNCTITIKNKEFYGELRTCANNKREIYIHNDDKELFRKCREIWNKITELIGIRKAEDFVETALDDGDDFIIADVHKNTSFVRGNYRNKLVIVLHSVIDNYLEASLVQHRY